ncbi:MAG: GAF domain-containing protein [Myxococcaceae bacterium]
MAETLLDVRTLPKAEAYAELDAQGRAVLEGVTDAVAAMATFSALLHHGLGHLWTGFYRVVETGGSLRVGPYQGTLGCLEIAFGRGVCGTAAASGRTVVVPDVEKFPGHISCDGRSRSEIVVPVFDRRRRLLAVLDIDSALPAAFDAEDQQGLERMMGWFEQAELQRA